MEINSAIEDLIKNAIDMDASSAKIIPAKDIFVEQWVRQKCQYGCGGYALRFTCPPYTPTPDETKKMLEGYSQALLIEFSNLRSGEKQPNIQEIMYELERKAFLDGFYKAFSYSAGPCKFCESCPASEIDNPSPFSKRMCRHQGKARPAMEACGIDVYQTAKKAGYEIDVVKNVGDIYKRFGLLLLY